MVENKSTKWTVGCKIVQWRYNTQYHSTIFDYSFWTPIWLWCQASVGIYTLPISADMLMTLSMEGQLNYVYHDNMNATLILLLKHSVALAEAAQSMVDHVRSDPEKFWKKKRKASPEVLKANQTAKRSKDHGMATTLLQSSPVKTVDTQSPGKQSARSGEAKFKYWWKADFSCPCYFEFL